MMVANGIKEKTYQWAIGLLIALLLIFVSGFVGTVIEAEKISAVEEKVESHMEALGHPVTINQLNNIIDRLERIERKIDEQGLNNTGRTGG